MGFDSKNRVRVIDEQRQPTAVNEAAMTDGRSAWSAHFSYITEPRSVLPSGL